MDEATFWEPTDEFMNQADYDLKLLVKTWKDEHGADDYAAQWCCGPSPTVFICLRANRSSSNVFGRNRRSSARCPSGVWCRGFVETLKSTLGIYFPASGTGLVDKEAHPSNRSWEER